MPVRTEGDVLQGYLERRIPVLFGRPVAITGIQRQRCDYASSYDSDIVTVQFQTSGEFKIFLKDFGFTRFPKNGAKQRRDRERSVYQELLAETNLGTAEYYGSIWDESQGR